MPVVSQGALTLMVPGHWERVKGSGTLDFATDEGAVRLELNVGSASALAPDARTAAGLLARIHHFAKEDGFTGAWDEVAKEGRRKVAAASFESETICCRFWEILDGDRLISVLLACPPGYLEKRVDEAELIVRTARFVVEEQPQEGSLVPSLVVTLALMLVTDGVAYGVLLISGGLFRCFGLLIMLWFVWAPSMALGYLISRGRLRTFGLVFAAVGGLGATLWIAGPALFLALLLPSAITQGLGPALALAFACLVTQGFHFLFAASAVATLGSLWVHVFRRDRRD